IDEAQLKANQIIQDAETKAEASLKEASNRREREEKLFKSSLEAACRQGIMALRQDIENHLFNKELGKWIKKETADPNIGAKLITALVQAIEKEGIDADFSALIPTTISAEQVNALLLKEIVQKLRERSVIVGEFVGGVQLKLHDQNLTLDISDEALRELIGPFISDRFRELVFQV
ncbi:MAG: V-type ATP synthase subunit E, partial [Chlamydiales bacterium]